MADTALIVAAVAGGFAITSTALNVLNARSIERMKSQGEAAKRAAEDRKQISIYSEALARAAFDLQSRIYNILNGDFIGEYLERGSERERVYAVENTTFLISQFLCWLELTRQEINFIQLDDVTSTKKLLRAQDDVYAAWSTSRWPPVLRLFAGEQRALGESLIVGDPEYTTSMGYGRFLSDMPSGVNEIADHVRAEVEKLPSTLEQAKDRLTSIQHLLVGMIDLIDPDQIRFPAHRRSKA